MKLVSIIIPVYNRASLLSETLDSIKVQTYKNWECIIVDDKSTDNSLQIIQEFSKKDSRIKVFKRPGTRKKGANSCRNFGLQNSSGDFIIWFDSDDLMTQDHVERKVKKIQEENYDFVVSQTQNFQDDKFLSPYVYEKKKYGIRASDFILLKIHWYTYDVMLKRKIAEKIEWNNKMRSWQDYNYFCKMLLVTENGTYLDKVLTHRRLHSNSIQKHLNKSPENFRSELLENRLLTYRDLEAKIAPEIKKELIYGLMNLCFEISSSGAVSSHFPEVIQITTNNIGKMSGFYFRLSVLFARIFEKGNFMLELAKSRQKELRT